MTSLDGRTAAALDRRLAEAQARDRLPSVVAGAVRGSRPAWWGGAGEVGGGPPGPDTQYRIGSITKSLVAVCVLRLRDEGVLDLADPVDRHVPGTPVGAATVAHLLSHSSGVQAETGGPWWERTPGTGWKDLAAEMGGNWARHPPGRRFHYSNVGFAVLGTLVARSRGVPWHEVVSREVLLPLGMRRTTTRPVTPYAPGLAVHPWADVVLAEPEHDAGAMAPAGQLWSTVTDLGRWAAFLGGDTGDVLAAGTLAEMAEPRVLDDVPGAPWTAAYGLGLQVWNADGRRAVGHGGTMPGFQAAVRVDVGSGGGVVVLANTTAGLAPELVTDLASILASDAPAPAAWTPSPVDAQVLGLAGVWYWGPAPLVLRVLPGGAIELQPLAGVGGRGRGARFRPGPGGTWTGLDGYYHGETLRAVRRRDGSVSHLDVASFVLTRAPYDPAAGVPGGVDPAGWH